MQKNVFSYFDLWSISQIYIFIGMEKCQKNKEVDILKDASREGSPTTHLFADSCLSLINSQKVFIYKETNMCSIICFTKCSIYYRIINNILIVLLKFPTITSWKRIRKTNFINVLFIIHEIKKKKHEKFKLQIN